MSRSHALSLVFLSLAVVACDATSPANDEAMMEDAPTMGMPVLDDDPTNDTVDEMIVEPDGAIKEEEESLMQEGGMMKKIEDAGGDGMMDKPMMARTVTITADNWSFSPNSVRASVGETVTLEITGAAGMHGFSIPDLGINESVSPGQTVTIALPTDTAGTFAFKCSIPCGSGHKDMKGTIIIE